jgi:hypothetical protein
VGGRVLDLTGRRFGNLTVVCLLRKDTLGYVWLCRCACGREVEMLSKHARVRQSCGNCQPQRRDLTGTTRGTWQVVDVASRDRRGPSAWQCRCVRCGRECVLPHRAVASGKPRACGCIPRGRPRNTSLSKRDRAIIAARKRGLLLRAIAARFGLTRQRVQQIVRQAQG